MSRDMEAYRCRDCNTINVMPRDHQGGRCIECDGSLIYIGKAKMHGKNIGGFIVDLNVNTTELDMALEKARELNKLLDRL